MITLILLTIFAIISLTTEMLGMRKAATWTTLVGLLAAIGVNVYEWGATDAIFSNMMITDNFARAFSTVLFGIAAILVLVSPRFFETYPTNRPENYALMLFSLVGGVMMLAFGNLSMLFLGVEMLSIPMYVLAGSDKQNLLSNEASLKYFLMGAFASAFLLFGIALVYGASGTFDLTLLSKYTTTNAATLPPIFLTGILMIIVAMAFKVSAVPLHFWAPDVYDGSPTLITMFMATIVKIAAFGTFLKLFVIGFSGAMPQYIGVLAAIAAITMCVGNFSALFQSSFKRMMAFSGVAHAGYLMIGILIASASAYSAVLYYSIGYAAATVSAFSVLLLLTFRSHNEEGEAFKGLAKKHPVLAAVATIAMLSLAGIPPTAGFVGKYSLFVLAIQNGYVWLAVIGILNSLISVMYYLRIVVYMYTGDAPDDKALEIPLAYKIGLFITTSITLLFGLMPDLLAKLLG